jgi:hypothetical protein
MLTFIRRVRRSSLDSLWMQDSMWRELDLMCIVGPYTRYSVQDSTVAGTSDEYGSVN